MLRWMQSLFCAVALCLLMVGCQVSSDSYQHEALSVRQGASVSTRAAKSLEGERRVNAEAPPSPEPGEPAAAFRPQIIYRAELALRADRVEVVQEKAEALVAKHRGYIGESGPGRMVLRIPAAVFETALDELAGLGEVTNRRVFAEDVTERVVDLESRLRSAEVLRERLIEMVKGAENLEHALKVEQELARVSEQIELIQGRLRLAKQQIAFATITLTIQATPAEQRLTPGIPIAWVRELGGVFRERNTVDVTTPRRLRDGVDVDLPKGFIRYYQEGYVTQAVDANGIRVRVRRFKNIDEGPMVFWERLILRSLDRNGGLDLEEVEGVELERGGDGRLIRGQKKIAGETAHYLIAIGVSDDGDYVYAFEAWGVAEYYDQVADELIRSIHTMRCY